MKTDITETLGGNWYEIHTASEYHKIIRHTVENDCAEIDCINQHDLIVLHFARSHKTLSATLEKIQKKLEFLRDAAKTSDDLNLSGGRAVYEGTDAQETALTVYNLIRMVEVVKALRGFDYDAHNTGLIDLYDIISLLKISV